MYLNNYKAYGLTSFLKALSPIINEETFDFHNYTDKIILSFYYLNGLNNKKELLQATVYKHRKIHEHCNVVEIDQDLLEEMLKNNDSYNLLGVLESYERPELTVGKNEPPKYDHCHFRKNGETAKIKRENSTLKDVCQYPVEKSQKPQSQGNKQKKLHN